MKTNKDLINQAMMFTALVAALQTKARTISPEEREQRAKDIEDEKEKLRFKWFINQGKCPRCGTKLKRGKKGKDHIRKWWCIKCNINLTKEE